MLDGSKKITQKNIFNVISYSERIKFILKLPETMSGISRRKKNPKI